MDTNTTTNSFEFESKYFELEKQILTLIAEDENEALFGGINANHSSLARINKPRSILEQKNERYLYWKHNFQNTTEVVPVWLKNSWRSTRHGTGVFIPCAGNENIPSGRCKSKARKLNRLVDYLRRGSIQFYQFNL